jgi:hypothetical protein
VFAKAFAWDGGSGIGDVSGQTKRVNSCDFRPARPFKVVTASEDFAVSLFAGPPFRFARSVHKVRTRPGFPRVALRLSSFQRRPVTRAADR